MILFTDDSFFSRSEQQQEDAPSDMVNIVIKVSLEAPCCVAAAALGHAAFSRSLPSVLHGFLLKSPWQVEEHFCFHAGGDGTKIFKNTIQNLKFGLL